MGIACDDDSVRTVGPCAVFHYASWNARKGMGDQTFRFGTCRAHGTGTGDGFRNWCTCNKTLVTFGIQIASVSMALH